MTSAGLTIVAKVAIATGPAVFAINLIILYIIYFSIYEISILLHLP